MMSPTQRAAYDHDGFIVVPDLLTAGELAEIRDVIAMLVERAAEVETHTDVYDLEPGHTPDSPRVRRIKAPHKVHAVFDEVVRSPQVIGILKALLGPGLRLHGSKLNMKSAHYGSPVEWHQEWAFYPHTNDDVLAIGVLLDDTDLSNGPMLVSPGTHTGPVWSHHGADGRFAGLIDPDEIRAEVTPALRERCAAAACAAFAALELRDYARVDLRVAADGTPYVIDVNPNCDLSDGAGVSRAASFCPPRMKLAPLTAAMPVNEWLSLRQSTKFAGATVPRFPPGELSQSVTTRSGSV